MDGTLDDKSEKPPEKAKPARKKPVPPKPPKGQWGNGVGATQRGPSKKHRSLIEKYLRDYQFIYSGKAFDEEQYPNLVDLRKLKESNPEKFYDQMKDYAKTVAAAKAVVKATEAPPPTTGSQVAANAPPDAEAENTIAVLDELIAECLRAANPSPK